MTAVYDVLTIRYSIAAAQMLMKCYMIAASFAHHSAAFHRTSIRRALVFITTTTAVATARARRHHQVIITAQSLLHRGGPSPHAAGGAQHTAQLAYRRDGPGNCRRQADVIVTLFSHRRPKFYVVLTLCVWRARKRTFFQFSHKDYLGWAVVM